MEKTVLTREINDIMERIWSLTLEMPIRVQESPDPIGAGLHSCIEISGAWNGKLIVHFSEDLSDQVSRKIYCIADTQEPSDSQRLDSLAEITNILAGNLKTVLPEPCDLGLPEVSSAQVVADSPQLLHLGFQSNALPVSVEVVKYG